MPNAALVITSIAAPNAVLRTCAREAAARGIDFIVIGDVASPADFALDGCDFFSLDCQRDLPFRFAQNAPEKHYARKNIGYLEAMRRGADLLLETDDDNTPLDGFWQLHVAETTARVPLQLGWINVYRYFTEVDVWPRGFALNRLHDALPSLTEQAVIAPIRQGLADENPDVDAIFRLTRPLPLSFEKVAPVAVGAGQWCPFNSQNTAWDRVAFPLLYLPSYCSFRMTDIWRSFVAQRVGWTCGWHLLFHKATVVQERNEHDLLKDFADEVPGYLHNEQICVVLKALALPEGPEHLLDNLYRCYEALVTHGWIGQHELPLLKTWIEDITELGF